MRDDESFWRRERIERHRRRFAPTRKVIGFVFGAAFGTIVGRAVAALFNWDGLSPASSAPRPLFYVAWGLVLLSAGFAAALAYTVVVDARRVRRTVARHR